MVKLNCKHRRAAAGAAAKLVSTAAPPRVLHLAAKYPSSAASGRSLGADLKPQTRPRPCPAAQHIDLNGAAPAGSLMPAQACGAAARCGPQL